MGKLPSARSESYFRTMFHKLGQFSLMMVRGFIFSLLMEIFYRFIINYEDLVPPSAKPSRLVSTNVSRFFWHSVFVTSGLDQNFFMASSPISNREPCSGDELLIGYYLDDSTGRLLPKSWKIFPEVPSGSCFTESKLASKDGKVSWFAGTKLPQFKRIFYFQEFRKENSKTKHSKFPVFPPIMQS
jgi:hypothetical protein